MHKYFLYIDYVIVPIFMKKIPPIVSYRWNEKLSVVLLFFSSLSDDYDSTSCKTYE